MKRKRYIKLIMSCGCDRNTANVSANRLRLIAQPYGKGITREMQYCTFMVKGLGVKMRGGRWHHFVYPRAIQHVARITEISVVPSGGYPIDKGRWNDPQAKTNPLLDVHTSEPVTREIGIGRWPKWP